jgi:hypothetical protein
MAKSEDVNSYQQELRANLNRIQQTIKGDEYIFEALWDLWVSGKMGDSENRLRMVMELLLLASQSAEGESLFINALEYIKTDYPHLAEELWEAYDNWDNIHKTDYFRLEE